MVVTRTPVVQALEVLDPMEIVLRAAPLRSFGPLDCYL